MLICLDHVAGANSFADSVTSVLLTDLYMKTECEVANS